MTDQVWWYMARAGGTMAWIVAGLAILVGLAMPAGFRAGGARRPWLLDLHRYLGGLTFAFIGLHLFGLWADSFVHFGPVELFVPFTGTWQPNDVAWGIAAFWLLLAVEATSLVRDRLPRHIWHSIHLLSYLVFIAGTQHALASGTDVDNPLLRALGWTLVLAIGGATVLRVRVARQRAARNAAAAEMQQDSHLGWALEQGWIGDDVGGDEQPERDPLALGPRPSVWITQFQRRRARPLEHNVRRR